MESDGDAGKPGGEKKLALESGLVSNEAADKLLNDRTSVSFLEKYGNLNLRKGMTQEQKRAAIRQAVEKVVHKEKTTAGGEGSLDTDGGKGYDDSKKIVSGGLTDGGEETGLDAGKRAGYYRNDRELLWSKAGTEDTGERIEREGTSAFVERSEAEGKTVVRKGRWSYAARLTAEENYTPETQEAMLAAAEWGLTPVVMDGYQKNDGSKTFSGIGGITTANGRVYLVNGSGRGTLAHEALHSGMRRNVQEAQRFYGLIKEVDISEETLGNALAKITEAYYDKEGRSFDPKKDMPRLSEEAAAFISEMIETGRAEEIFGLTEENSPELFAAWREFKAAMGANPMQPNQDGTGSEGELSYLQKDILKPADGSLVSDEMADHLLGDQSSVSFLTRKGGLKLSKKMTQEQRGSAVKEAVARIARRKKTNELVELATKTKSDILEQGTGQDITSADTTKKDLTEEGQAAILSYKSSESYKVNAKLRDEIPLSDAELQMVEQLDTALKKLPVYKGIVYRNLGFDDFGGETEMNRFLSLFTVGDGIRFRSYTSASKIKDGHPIDGKYVVNMEIQSFTGKILAGFGNDSEQEVLFGRDRLFIPVEITVGQDGHPLIKLIEVEENENAN